MNIGTGTPTSYNFREKIDFFARRLRIKTIFFPTLQKSRHRYPVSGPLETAQADAAAVVPAYGRARPLPD